MRNSESSNDWYCDGTRFVVMRIDEGEQTMNGRKEKC